jgi:hypothetical protein
VTYNAGCVANFAQEVVKGQLPLSMEGLRGQGIEQFGRSEALVSLLDYQLSSHSTRFRGNALSSSRWS